PGVGRRSLAHIPENWVPVSRLREAPALSHLVGRCFGGRGQVRTGYAPTKLQRVAITLPIAARSARLRVGASRSARPRSGPTDAAPRRDDAQRAAPPWRRRSPIRVAPAHSFRRRAR